MELTEELGDVSDSPKGKSPEELLIDQESAESLQERIEALLSPMEYDILQRYLNGTNYVQICGKHGEEPEVHRQCAAENPQKN